MVTLSACETGLGDVAAGEGVYGLTSTLHQSGVRSVLASLGKVEDAATQELMRRFYENLWVKKQTKAVALRNAQLWMIDHSDDLEALGVHDATNAVGLTEQAGRQRSLTLPRHWAAFQLSGDWR